MMPELAILISTGFLPAPQRIPIETKVAMLAPHPVYFSVDGKDSEIEVLVKGEPYTVTWGKKGFEMKPGVMKIVDVRKRERNHPSGLQLLLFWLGLVSAMTWFYVLAISIFFGNWKSVIFCVIAGSLAAGALKLYGKWVDDGS